MEANTQATREVFEQVLAKVKGDAENYLRNRYNRLADEALTFVGKSAQEWDEFTANRYNRYRRFSNEDYQFQSLFLHHKNGMMKGEMESSLGKPKGYKYVNGQEICCGVYTREEFVNKKVDEKMQLLFEGFILKQVKKTDEILKGRNTKVTGYVSNQLEGYFTFEMEDGARFEMKTQIVWQVSNLGNPYWRFPTTFHNAVKANKEPVKTPSEAKLKKEL